MSMFHHHYIKSLGNFVGKSLFYILIIIYQSGCLYLGDIEEIQPLLPLEFDISYPVEGETLFLNPNNPNHKAIVFVWYSGPRTNISFTWLIGPETLPAEFVPDEDEIKLGSIVDLSTPDENWDGQNLTVHVSVSEPRSTISRSWPIEIQESN